MCVVTFVDRLEVCHRSSRLDDMTFLHKGIDIFTFRKRSNPVVGLRALEFERRSECVAYCCTDDDTGDLRVVHQRLYLAHKSFTAGVGADWRMRRSFWS